MSKQSLPKNTDEYIQQFDPNVRTTLDGESILNPMRVVANGEGCEIKFTLFQLPEMTDGQFAKDTGMVEADLRTLKGRAGRLRS